MTSYNEIGVKSANIILQYIIPEYMEKKNTDVLNPDQQIYRRIDMAEIESKKKQYHVIVRMINGESHEYHCVIDIKLNREENILVVKETSNAEYSFPLEHVNMYQTCAHNDYQTQKRPAEKRSD